MSIFDKFAAIAETRDYLKTMGIDPFNNVVESLVSPTEGVVDGQPTVLAGTNNYLGLTFDQECIDAAKKALDEHGTGTTGSRMANGTYAGHVALEQELADFYGCDSAIVFSTGFLANLGVVSTLASHGDVILLDADCHASIYDGCRLGGAEVVRFRHNDAADLDKRLRRLGERASNALILVEGLYSMLGDRAPLADIVAVKRKHGAYLLVDEAHSLGMVGATGRGVTEEAGVEDGVDFIIGTFSKSLGATGGYCVSRLPELELVRYAIRAYVFTAAPAPSVIASTRKALEILRARPELRERLWRNAHHLYTGLTDLGYSLGPEPSPVIAVMLDKKEDALEAWRALLEHGVYVNVILPPATPSGGSLLRCSVSAAHTPEQIDHVLRGFAAIRNRAPSAMAV